MMKICGNCFHLRGITDGNNIKCFCDLGERSEAKVFWWPFSKRAENQASKCPYYDPVARMAKADLEMEKETCKRRQFAYGAHCGRLL